jgi:hypothetical protein
MTLKIKYARPGSGQVNIFSSLYHRIPTLDKCEVKRVNSRPTLVMIPSQEKDDKFVAPCCYLAFECIGAEQTNGLKVILTAIFPDPRHGQN